MILNPFSGLRRVYGWLLFSIILGLPIGYWGVGPIMYFGPVLFIAVVISIFQSKSAKKRAILWGLLLGISGAFLATYSLFGWHETS